MYKIFAKDKCVYLVDKTNLIPVETGVKSLNYTDPQQLLKEYELFLSTEKFNRLYIFADSIELLKENYFSIFNIIEAAGGVVKNKHNELLLIFRLGCWDLPKGKIEKGENVDEAAIREVQEECGIQQLKIINELTTSYHSYQLNGKHIIKKTYWYEMFYTGSNMTLVPQTEESITDARWMNARALATAMQNTYPLIQEVLYSTHFNSEK